MSATLSVGDYDRHVAPEAPYGDNFCVVRTAASLTAVRTWKLPRAGMLPEGFEMMLVDEYGACNAVAGTYVQVVAEGLTGDPDDPYAGDQIGGFSNTTAFPLLNPRSYLRLRTDGATTWTIVAQDQADLQQFTATGTWIKHPSTRYVDVFVWGAAGGGASGRRGAAGTDRRGGGSGGAGGGGWIRIPAGSLGTTVAITIGAGGTAGAAVTSNDTNGSDGGNGGTTSFGTHLSVAGGLGGKGGQAAGGGLGGAGSDITAWPNVIPGASPSGATALGGIVGRNALSWTTGAAGGAGGSITTGDTNLDGGAGGAGTALTGPAGGSGGAGGAGAAGTTGGGCGGAGGGGGGYAGGAGGARGGSGGGGGASANGTNSGAGGAGGRGEVHVYAYR